jgi:DNA-binding NarL/FixJ family response regulator
MTVPIRVFLIAPGRLFAEALRTGLGEAGAELLGDSAGVGTQPDVGSADVVLVHDSAGGLPAIRRAKQCCAGCPVLALGVEDRPEDVLAAIQAGADGYVPKTASIPEMVEAITAAHSGRATCSPRVLAELFSRVRALSQDVRPAASVRPDQLSRRERQILDAIARGLTNKEIAHDLGISVFTVKNHVHKLLDKLGVGHRRAAARYVIDADGIVEPSRSTNSRLQKPGRPSRCPR